MRFASVLGVALVASLVSGCSCSGSPAAGTCTSSSDCHPGMRCVDSRCVAATDGGAIDSAVDLGPLADLGPVDAGDHGPCDAAGLCQDDSRCISGRCIPWPDGGSDPTCHRPPSSGPLRPSLQCVWTAPPAGDSAPTFTHVLHTPLVANLGIPAELDAPPRPAIVFVSDATYTEGAPRTCMSAGTLRIIDGATCREIAEATAMADRVSASVTPAIGDLDGDGAPEIVAAGADGGVMAFGWDHVMGRLVRRWSSTMADGSPDLGGGTTCQWGGVSLADLDDDGHPEVILDGYVWSNSGVRLATIPGWVGYPWGVPAVIANIDDDPAPELVGGEGVWEWTGGAFVADAGFTDAGHRGFTALADFGDFAGQPGDAPGRPEIVVVGSSHIVVLSIGGGVIRDVTIPSAGGGPPTVADYDGDGHPEIGAAFGSEYVVYDVIDDRILWSQPSQDLSSARTGSSVFDFNADGRAEVVYGDECYVRVYDGLTGAVAFSQARFSSTWEENPIVADVDGDGAAEIVMGMSGPCSPTYCPMLDPLHSGLTCDVAADCPGGTCDTGFCRCVMDTDCGDGYACTTPLAGTAGTGNVCRARHLDCLPGLRVYRDARDRWASSRQIWNQHAYAVTNVDEDGTIPRTSTMMRNWATTGLNNFRANVQGGLTDIPGPDLTVGNLVAFCESMTSTRLSADVCNRGSALTDLGVEVIFVQGTTELCRLRTSDPVPPGTCRTFDCVAPVPADGTFTAVVDPDMIVGECVEGDNTASGVAHCLM